MESILCFTIRFDVVLFQFIDLKFHSVFKAFSNDHFVDGVGFIIVLLIDFAGIVIVAVG